MPQPVSYVTEEDFRKSFLEVIDEYGDDQSTRWGGNDPHELMDWIETRLKRRSKDPDGFYNFSRACQLIKRRSSRKLVRGANDYLDRVQRLLKRRKVKKQPS